MNRIPVGSFRGRFKCKSYRVTRLSFNNQRSFKFYAEELGGNDFVSANCYLTSSGIKLIPCEMEEDKVIEFLSCVEIMGDFP